MRMTRLERFERRKIAGDAPPHWYDRPEIDREALRRLAIKDRARSISCADHTFTPQAIVVEEKR